MNRRSIPALETIRSQGRAALVGYLPAGYPSVADSVEAALTLVEGGVDILEVGLPYSDPVLDGPVIQRACTQALASGFTVDDLFDTVAQIRHRSSVPVLVMTYWNPVMRRGVDTFARQLRQAGAAGLITPDLVPDEAAHWAAAAQAHELDQVYLAAPSSSQERLRKVVQASTGFVYAAARMGVTGTQATLSGDAPRLLGRLRGAGAQHACVGLGVSTPEQVASLAAEADGVIIGSAFIAALNTGGLERLGELASAFRAATSSAKVNSDTSRE